MRDLLRGIPPVERRGIKLYGLLCGDVLIVHGILGILKLLKLPVGCI